jgi:hypothetical protein
MSTSGISGSSLKIAGIEVKESFLSQTTRWLSFPQRMQQLRLGCIA